MKKVFPNPFKNFSKWAWVEKRVSKKAARCAVDETCPIRLSQASLRSRIRHISYRPPDGVRHFLTDFVFAPCFCKGFSRCYECAPLRKHSTSRSADTRLPGRPGRPATGDLKQDTHSKQASCYECALLQTLSTPRSADTCPPGLPADRRLATGDFNIRLDFKL